jgi:hypothetical protein
VSVRVFRAAVSSLCFFLLAAAASKAQTPPPPTSPPQALQPVTGFVPSYEIVHTLRAAGFNPLAPPLREGTIYVVRATDYRGILMRVVVDARTGAIRDASRIVPGPGRYGAVETEPPPDGSTPPYYGLPPYGRADYDEPGLGSREKVAAPASSRPNVAPTAIPLPRPRPAEVAAENATRKPDATSGIKTEDAAGSAKPDEINSNARASGAPNKIPAVVPSLND